ncbi:MAG: rhodanese-related sulfurtransferase [Candidatus Magasanikbacteria bacterium]|nr:rhodanese-related sulfurtransferase [Candidatus Magasanikbacteria bacterium]
MPDSYQILLYYKYTKIEDPTALMQSQREICTRLGFKGRILIAEEGINGTLEGETAATEAYVAALLSDPRFSDIHIKRSVGTGSAFNKMSIKVRQEIVGTHFPAEIDPRAQTSEHITAEQLHELLHNSDEKVTIIDMRNDYEFKIGHFENSILPSLENSRDLALTVKELKPLKNEKIITVCTGGVRCEKMSAYLLREGFTNVSQLYGGIVTYMEKFPNKDFKGKLYVFDNRISMGFETDSPDHQIITNCEHCNVVSDHYINCTDMRCHKQIISCVDCVASGKTVC